MIDRPLDVKGLADYLGVGVDWVYTQVEAGAIPHSRLPAGTARGGRGKLIRFTAEHVAAILAFGETPTLNAPTLSLVAARRRRRGA